MTPSSDVPPEPDQSALDLATRVFLALRAAGETLATAESLTGGQLAALVTDVPGVSDTYLGGVVSYATELKISLLGVSAELVEEHGVVSGPCAEAMATGVRGLTGSTWALATTGVAGPTAQEGKPVGTVYVGIAGPGRVEAIELSLDGDRPTIQEQTCERALAALDSALTEQVRRESRALG
ncbi:CinA family protein [Nocardioides sp. BP30]|uniref:CinA family protein n=1 Tax=Nocardioides sp. BP30 TaxID=3036374 RepID=UPI002468C6B8|nr:CinA family protein [Nocardioides sp. BP30]WGL50939.1 CinA family protein [Nocardioides sp. BP30]